MAWPFLTWPVLSWHNQSWLGLKQFGHPMDTIQTPSRHSPGTIQTLSRHPQDNHQIKKDHSFWQYLGLGFSYESTFSNNRKPKASIKETPPSIPVGQFNQIWIFLLGRPIHREPGNQVPTKFITIGECFGRIPAITQVELGPAQPQLDFFFSYLSTICTVICIFSYKNMCLLLWKHIYEHLRNTINPAQVFPDILKIILKSVSRVPRCGFLCLFPA